MSSWFHNGNIYIKKKTFPEVLVFVVLIFPFLESFLTEFLPFPRAMRYILDVIIVVLLVSLFWKGRLDVNGNALPLLILVGLFFLYVLVTYIFSYQSPFYFLWGLRNYFRFYIAFFAFIMAVKENYAYYLLKLLDYLFWINAAVSLVQFFVMNVRQDYLGGLFGVYGASNGYSSVFFFIIVGKSLLSTFNGDEKPILCVLKCGTSLLIAAMAEMKFYFFCFILILFVTSFITRFTKRKFFIVFAAILSVMIFSVLLSNIFADGTSFLTIDKLWELATKDHYSSEGDLNRLSAIPTLMRNYVTEPIEQIFGLGLGNCDSSNISLFNTPFYQQHAYLHYIWFTSAILFLETGFVGLVFYILFFVICMIHCFRQMKRNSGNRLFCQMGIIMSLLSVILMFYNASMRVEAAYMIYFILSLPFISANSLADSSGVEVSIEKQ